MHKISFFLLSFFILLLSFSAKDQNEKIRIQVGGVLDYYTGTNYELTDGPKGYNIGIEAFLLERLSINLNYTNYPTQKIDYNSNSKASKINLNGRYYFINKPISSYLLSGYLLSGLAYQTGESKFKTLRTLGPALEPAEYEYDWLRVNFGLGLRGRISDQISLFMQVKLQVDTESIYFEPFNNIVFYTGLSYRLK